MPKSIHKLVEEAKAEARKNLTGEDLEKCLTALDNWERNVNMWCRTTNE